jgi:hypothetical protein
LVAGVGVAASDAAQQFVGVVGACGGHAEGLLTLILPKAADGHTRYAFFPRRICNILIRRQLRPQLFSWQRLAKLGPF